MARSKRKRASGNDFTALPVGVESGNQQQGRPLLVDSAASGVEQRRGGRNSQILFPTPTQAVPKASYPPFNSQGRGIHRKISTPAPKQTGIDSIGSRGRANELRSPSLGSLRPGRQSHAGVGGKASTSSDISSPAIPRRLTPLRQVPNHRSSPLQHAHANPAAFAKVRYLERIAAWAAARVPSLGALYGMRLKRTGEATAISSPIIDSLCERCETVLLPDVNCSVNLPRNKPRKRRKSSKLIAGPSKSVRNGVQYKCQYCNHDNWKSSFLQQEARTKAAQAAARAQMEDEGNKSQIMPLNSIQEQQICSPDGQNLWTALVGSHCSTGVDEVDDDPENNEKHKPDGEWGPDSKSLPLQNKCEMSCSIRSNCLSRDEPRTALIQRVEKTCAEANDQFVTPAAPPLSISVVTPSSETPQQPDGPGSKKRKRKGWTTLKSIATSSFEKGLPKPVRLGFSLDPSKPLI